MNLVIVESPAKAKTINKYLGPNYQVLASYGHVRDLPSKNGSVDPEDDFAMLWEVDGKSAKRLSDIAAAMKDADRLILATDPDREGEAISWHVLEVLRAKRAIGDKPVERVVFNAITRDAVLDAMQHPRKIDAPLVDAYLARRALDYLVGFTLSPVLWRKLPGARSAGRVQSVALRLVCERENEIEIFRPREYWSVAVTLEPPNGGRFVARVVGFNQDKLGRLDIADEATARRIEGALKSGAYKVASIEAKPVRRNPPPPFTTSTLQQEASRKLGFTANRTMQVAQRLYEDGLITYMRTDGVQSAPEAIAATRAMIAKRFGDQYVPESARLYQTKAKNAQEAHEAIRPTDLTRTPDGEAHGLEADQARLYELVWKRMTASQMASAELERTTADIAAGVAQPVNLRATGQVVRFDGFLTLYQEGKDEDAEDEDGSRLPPMAEGDRLTEHGIAIDQHFTEPPPRYTEATLIKKMEELGIGRPSTYAATLSVLRDRGYVRLDKRQLIPEDKGRLVTAFLQSFFDRYVEYDFTADLEEKLDKISNGDLKWKDVLRDFWRQFSSDVDKTKELRVSEVLDVLNELLGPHIFPARADGGDPRQCPSCGTGRLSLKLGKFGAFIGCSNYPECRYTRQLAVSEGGGAEIGTDGKLLGTDPETGLNVTLRTGRFGPYMQLGEQGEDKDVKPKRASIPARLGDRRARPRQGALAAPPAARSRPPPGDRQADHRRHRPLRAVRAPRRHLRQPRFRRGGVQRRPQPRRLGAGRKGRRRRPSRPRHGEGAEGARRPSRGRQDHGPRRQVRTLRQPRQGQRDAAQGPGPAGSHRRPGAGADRCPRRQNQIHRARPKGRPIQGRGQDKSPGRQSQTQIEKEACRG